MVADAAGLLGHMLPVPLLPPPRFSRLGSAVLRIRRHRRLTIWCATNEILLCINRLNAGSLRGRKTLRPNRPPSAEVAYGWSRVHARALSEAARLERGRRTFGLSGAHAVASMLKTEPAWRYSFKDDTSAAHEVLRADDVDEPDHNVTVDLLDAIPVEEAEFYSDEGRVVDYPRFTAETFAEIQTRYGFGGGTEEEYEKYFL